MKPETKTMTKAQFAAHVLKGEHKYVKVGIKNMCRICGKIEGMMGVPFVFASGDKVSSQQMNDNFKALIDAIAEMSKEIEQLKQTIIQLQMNQTIVTPSLPYNPYPPNTGTGWYTTSGGSTKYTSTDPKFSTTTTAGNVKVTYDKFSKTTDDKLKTLVTYD